MELPKDKKIILFDGVCNLCNGWVNYVIDRDKKDVFRFASLQSDVGQQIIAHLKINPTIDSILLYAPSQYYYYKSEAIIDIMESLGGVYSLFGLVKIFPESIRNWAYDYVAKNRYKWYGKRDQCRLPTPELKSKFL